MKLYDLTTEKRNINSMNLDQMSTGDILKTINKEDQKIAITIEEALGSIEIAVENIYRSLQEGGRLFYVGAGTSGRLGILDASECPPTFMTPSDLVQSLMAGGQESFQQANEQHEDNEWKGKADLIEKELVKNDVVIGITASGVTPYPIGAVKYAREVGAYTVSLSCNKNSLISKFVDCGIEVEVGPEILTGSTRMKAATAQKMVLNMISTTTMVKLGKVYENLMVDVHANNNKLHERAKRIVMEVTHLSYEEAENMLTKTNYEVKPALVMYESDASFAEAKKALKINYGYVRESINYLKSIRN